MKIYLASPFFEGAERAIMTDVLQRMREQGHEVYAPYEHEVKNAWDKSNADWAREVFFEDINAIKECDEVWVISYGLYSDTGTAWECGYAYGLGKTVRQLIDVDKDKHSLMMINGCEEVVNLWYYLGVDDDDELKIEQK